MVTRALHAAAAWEGSPRIVTDRNEGVTGRQSV